MTKESNLPIAAAKRNGRLKWRVINASSLTCHTWQEIKAKHQIFRKWLHKEIVERQRSYAALFRQSLEYPVPQIEKERIQDAVFHLLFREALLGPGCNGRVHAIHHVDEADSVKYLIDALPSRGAYCWILKVESCHDPLDYRNEFRVASRWVENDPWVEIGLVPRCQCPVTVGSLLTLFQPLLLLLSVFTLHSNNPVARHHMHRS